MAPKVTQALEVFIERDHIPENLSILTCTEEEEVQDYFDAEWDDDEDTTSATRSRSASVEAIWSSCSTFSPASVLGVCTPTDTRCTTPSKKAPPRRVRSPLRLSVGEASTARSLLRMASMPPLYRPSELCIDLSSIIGDPRGPKTSS
ncbi:unnamed protein product [Phytophthora lilii]|uniref:Unnamed protein product n=1 Tax=Phytophthora lilii TaxID=2077276 RepID=A0A9W7CRU7_9STRA|nr:unnamed protein product [Phytophthora lilii]